jgi:hypothetical protein
MTLFASIQPADEVFGTHTPSFGAGACGGFTTRPSNGVKLSVTYCLLLVTKVYSKTTIACVPSLGTATSAPLPAGVTLSVWLPGTTNALLGLNPLVVILTS